MPEIKQFALLSGEEDLSAHILNQLKLDAGWSHIECVKIAWRLYTVPLEAGPAVLKWFQRPENMNKVYAIGKKNYRCSMCQRYTFVPGKVDTMNVTLSINCV
jgi:hypothetical protein